MPELDEDGCFRLLAAVARRWIEDAHANPAELVEVAAWLDMEPSAVLARKLQPLTGRLQPLTGFRTGVWCPVCGREIRRVSDDPRGPHAKFCSAACRARRKK